MKLLHSKILADQLFEWKQRQKTLCGIENLTVKHCEELKQIQLWCESSLDAIWRSKILVEQVRVEILFITIKMITFKNFLFHYEYSFLIF